MSTLKQVELLLELDGVYTPIDIDLNTAFRLNLLYNDIINPTANKTPRSTDISIPQTKLNNDIFNHIWKIDHSILEFNPSIRTNFRLYINNSIFISGYVKLELIEWISKSYKIRLFDGIGDYFLEMSGLYINELDFGNLFNHTINLRFIANAFLDTRYDNSSGEDMRGYFGYAMTYQGLYDNFDSRYYVNRGDYPEYDPNDPNPNPQLDPGEVTWRSNNKVYSAGKELTEHHRTNVLLFDKQYYGEYRSYYLKPMIKVLTIINKIIDTMNDKGWLTELDESFFNRYNPYWNDLWCIFPNYESTSELSQDTLNFSDILPSISASTNLNNRLLSISFGNQFFNAGEEYNIIVDLPFYIKSLHSGDGDRIKKNYPLTIGALLYIGNTLIATLNPESPSVSGTNGRELYFNSKEGSNWSVNIKHPKNFTPARGDYYYYYTADKDDNGLNDNALKSEFKFTGRGIKYTGKDINEAVSIRLTYNGSTYWRTLQGRDRSEGLLIEVENATINIGSDIGSGIRSNSEIKYTDIVTSKDTCYDFFMSYMKIFGMYFKKDVLTKKLSILTRNSYFGMLERLDWTYKIDYSKLLTIKPVPFDYKVGVFKWKDNNTKYEELYINKYNVSYGSARFNNGYLFSDVEKNYLEGIIFNNGIVATDYNSFYKDRSNTQNKDNKQLFHFLDNDSKKVDINYVLTFKDLSTSTEGDKLFLLTDDNDLMLNYGYCWTGSTSSGGASLLSNYPSLKRVINIGGDNYSLNFGRPSVAYNDDEAELFVGDTTEGSETLYSRFWKGYLSDIYSLENKILTCYVNITNNDMNNDLFNKFIFINDTIWVINKIYNYNPTLCGSTKVDFVKVLDISNYVSQSYIAGNFIINRGGETIYNYVDGPNTNPVVIRVGENDTSVNLLFISDVNWSISNQTEGLVINPVSGSGTTNVSISFPPNTTGNLIVYNIPVRWGSTTTIILIVLVSNWTVSVSTNEGTATVNGSLDDILVSDGTNVVFNTSATGFIFGYWDINGLLYYSQTVTYLVTDNTVGTAYWFDSSDFGWQLDTLTIDNEGGLLTNRLNTSNAISYLISSTPSLTINPTSGVTSNDIIFTIPENETINDIIYTVTANFSNGFISTFTITLEAAKYININPELVNIDSNQNDIEVLVLSNGDWTVLGEGVSLSTTSGSGDGLVIVTVPANTELVTKFYNVTFTLTLTGEEKLLVISQAGFTPLLSINPELITINGNSTNYLVTVTSNTDWVIEIDPIYDAYFSASPLSGSGNGTVNINISANASSLTRIGEAVFKTVIGDVEVDHIITLTAGYGKVEVQFATNDTITFPDPIELEIVNVNGAVVDQYTISNVHSTGSSYYFEDLIIGDYTVRLSLYDGSSTTLYYSITPANSLSVEVTAGSEPIIIYTINVLNYPVGNMLNTIVNNGGGIILSNGITMAILNDAGTLVDLKAIGNFDNGQINYNTLNLPVGLYRVRMSLYLGTTTGGVRWNLTPANELIVNILEGFTSGATFLATTTNSTRSLAITPNAIAVGSILNNFTALVTVSNTMTVLVSSNVSWITLSFNGTDYSSSIGLLDMTGTRTIYVRVAANLLGSRLGIITVTSSTGTPTLTDTCTVSQIGIL